MCTVAISKKSAHTLEHLSQFVSKCAQHIVSYLLQFLLTLFRNLWYAFSVGICNVILSQLIFVINCSKQFQYKLRQYSMREYNSTRSTLLTLKVFHTTPYSLPIESVSIQQDTRFPLKCSTPLPTHYPSKVWAYSRTQGSLLSVPHHSLLTTHRECEHTVGHKVPS